METPQSLSPEELAEFTQALESVGANQKTEKKRDVRTYDFTHPDKLSKAHLRVIGQLMSSLERGWSSILQAKLRMESYVTLDSLEQAGFTAYAESIATPSFIVGINFGGLRCNALLDMPAALALGIVERLAGGGSELRGGLRELTQIECGIMKGVFDRMIVELNTAWKSVVQLDAKVTKFYSSVDDCGEYENEMVVICGFGWEIVGSPKHRVNLAIPMSALDSVRDKLTPEQFMMGGSSEDTKPVSAEMPKMLSSVPVTVEVELGRAKISVQDILDIGIGDVIKLDKSMDDQLDIKIQSDLKFRGRPGLVGSQQAIQITVDVEKQAIDRDNPGMSQRTSNSAQHGGIGTIPETAISDLAGIVSQLAQETN